MIKSDLPPLAEDVRALLDRVAALEVAPAGAKGRVRARIDDLLAPPSHSARAPAQDGAGPTVSVAARISLIRRLLPLAVSFSIGGGAGALIVASRGPVAAPPPPPRIVYVERAVTPPAPVAAVPVDRPDVTTQKSPAELIRPHGLAQERLPRPSSATRSAASSSLFQDPVIAERSLLDGARRALERHDGADALDVTKRHERQFPNGVLVQEREAIAIRALVLLDRRQEARARAQRFGAHFPHSVLLPTVESIVGAEQP